MKINYSENEIIRRLAFRILKFNHIKNIILIISIFLTTVLFTSVFTITKSLEKSIEITTLRQNGGEANINFKYITKAEEDEIVSSSHEKIDTVGKSIVLGLAYNPELIKRQSEIRYADKNYAKMSFDYPTTGRMPVKKNEIATDTLVLDMLDIPHVLGQKIELDYIDINGKQGKQTFRLCGFWKGDKIAPASQIWVSKKFINEYWVKENSNLDGIRMVSFKTNQRYSAENIAQEIINEHKLNNIKYSIFEPQLDMDSREKVKIYFSFISIILFILLSGYFIISNIYQISITKDINYFGRFKLLGASGKQIKKLLWYQTFFVVTIGISFGLISGYIVGYILLPHILNNNIGSDLLQLSSSPIIFAGSALLTIITIWFSCIKALKRASKVSPISASKYFENDFRKHNKRNYISIYLLSWRNIFRNKKRIIKVIVSLVMSAVLFECMYLIGSSFNLDKYLKEKMISDYKLSDYSVSSYTRNYEPNNTVSKKMLAETSKIDNKISINNTFYTLATINLENENVYNNVIKKVLDSKSEYRKEIEELKNKKTMKANVYGMDAELLNKCSVFLGNFSPWEYESGNYVLGIGYDDGSDNEILYGVGEKIKINNVNFIVMGYVDIPEVVLGSISEEIAPLTQGFVMSTGSFDKQFGLDSIYQSFINVSEDKDGDIQKLLEKYSAENIDLDIKSKKSYIEDFHSQIIAQTALGFMLSIVTGIIGIMNYINTTACSMFSRKREFNILQSIGMTSKQLKRMIFLENICIVILVSVFSLSLSLILGKTIVKDIIEAIWCSEFKFNLYPLFIIFIVFLIIAFFVPLAILNSQKGKSIIERLKDVGDSY